MLKKWLKYIKIVYLSLPKDGLAQITVWVLQEDNDPKHRSLASTEWKRENYILIMNWPFLSPDANPIENVWSMMKIKLGEKNEYNLK